MYFKFIILVRVRRRKVGVEIELRGLVGVIVVISGGRRSYRSKLFEGRDG